MPGELDDEMPAEIDFSGGERGKFYRPNAKRNLPAYSDVNETLRPVNLPAPGIALRQGSFFEQSDLIEAVASLANAGMDERGAIFTRREVVDFILDLCGYTVDRPLHAVQVLEPSFGGGDFLLAIIDRLLASWRAFGGEAADPAAAPVVDPALDLIGALSGAIRAVELHRASFDATRAKVIAVLVESGMSAAQAEALAHCWLIHGDYYYYLLAGIGGPFDVVVGNPPYVRQELIPDVLLTEYRARYWTVYDRADIYIPFIGIFDELTAAGRMARTSAAICL